MGFISGLCVFFAIVVVPIILIMSFVAPAKLDLKTPKNPNGKYERKQSLVGLGLLWLIAIVIGGVTAPDSQVGQPMDTTAKTAVDNPTTPTPVKTEINTQSNQAVATQAKQDKTFGMTPDEFAQRWADKAKQIGLGDNQMPRFNIQKGAVNDVFSANLSEGIAMTGTVDKATGNLKGISYIMGKTDKGDKEMMFLLAVASVTAQVLSPELSVDETGGKVVSMTTKAVDDYSKTQESTHNSAVVGKVLYSVGWIDKMGFMFSFEPA